MFNRTITKWKRAKGIVILAYHRIAETTGLFYDRNISATPEEFRWQMEYIKANYNVISGRQLIDYYDGKSGIPEEAIMITFDDGFKDTLENASPILRDMQLPATVFVPADFIDGQYFPWEDEAAYLINIAGDSGGANKKHAVDKDDLIFRFCKDLRGTTKKERENVLDKLYRDSALTKRDVQRKIIDAGKNMMDRNDLMKWVSVGLEVGGHTCSHPQLSKINDAQLKQELRSSKFQLEDITGQEVSIFAYPYGMNGYYDQNSIKWVEKTGYQCAVSLKGGINMLKTNRFDLKRMGVGRGLNFSCLCEGIK